MSLVLIEKRTPVAVLLIEHPPVNAMGVGVPAAIIQGLRDANADSAIRAIVLAGGGRGVIAGADIRRQGRPWPAGEPDLRDAIDAIEASAKPVVACLRAATLGGGLELAMACNYRVAAPQALLGQPEVKLGIPPGAGGTQRLPRLVGVETALEMILGGEPIDAQRAGKLGLSDATTDGDPLEFAVRFAAARAGQAQAHPQARARSARQEDPQAFDTARQRVARRAPGQRAPLACIGCVEAAVRLPFDEGIAFERRAFEECVASPEAAALRHLFLAERASRRIPGVSADPSRAPIDRAAVIGAGTMGSGIATCLASAGLPVALIEHEAQALQDGMARVRANYQGAVRRGRMNEPAAADCLARIAPGTDLGAAADADIVIEAVFEDLDLKRELFARLEGICSQGALLATNTSYLDVNRIAEAAPTHMANVLGMHFFSPAHVMRLLEVVRGEHTSAAALASAMELGRRLGKLPIVAGVCDGFIGNRMFEKYRREAEFLLEEGALPAQVDAVLVDFGFAMGPFAVSDLAGLDVSWRRRKAGAHARNASKRYSHLADRLCEAGRFGQKTGRGYYRYEEGKRVPLPDPEVEKLIVQTSAELGIRRRRISDEEIRERCLYPLVNEGARILEERIALRAGDIDLVFVNGYGFPRWRGGPLFWADRTGLGEVLAGVRRFHAEHDFWQPAPLLEELVAAELSFADLDADAARD